MLHILPYQRGKLQIPLHGEHLCHGITDRRTRGEHHAFAVRLPVEIAAFVIQVSAFLRLRLRNARYIAHFCHQKQVLKIVRLVHKQLVNAEFLKGHNAVLALLGVQLFELCRIGSAGLFHLLDGKAFLVCRLCVRYAENDLVKLLLQKLFLPLHAHGYAFKLAVTDHHRVVIACGDTGAKSLAVAGFKVLFACHEYVCRWVKLQKLGSDLPREMARHGDERFLTHTELLCLHSNSRHRVGLACAHAMRQKRVAAVERPRYRVHLMRTKGYLGIHAGETEVAAVIFARAGGVEYFVIHFHKSLTPVGVAPYPLGKGVLYCLLLLLCNNGFVLVQNTGFVAVYVGHGIEYPYVPKIKRILNDFVGVGSARAISGVCLDVLVVDAL